MIERIGIDADDTLWDEASRFASAEARFISDVQGWTGQSDIKTELRNFHFARLARVAFGPVGYREVLHEYVVQCLSPAIRKPAIELADEVCAAIIADAFTPLPGVAEALADLRGFARLSLVTKGDEQIQLHKLASSGLEWAFDDVIVVKEKNVELYRHLFGPSQAASPHAAMIGNSLKSDVLPAIEAGLFGIFVPHFHEAPLEVAPKPDGHSFFREFDDLSAAAAWIKNYRL